MKPDTDIFAGVLRELGALPPPPRKPKPSIDEELLGAAQEMTDTPTVVVGDDASSGGFEWAGKALVLASTQAADERARRETAEASAAKAKALIGWSVAGVLGAILIYILGTRRRP